MTTINTSTSLDEELKLKIEWLTDAQKDELLELLTQDKKLREKSTIESLYWNKDAILKDLKNNHVKVEENTEILWYKWKIIHVDLPSVWDFKWFNFDFFIWNKYENKKDVLNNSKLEENLYSMSEILELLKNTSNYMKACGIELDKNITDLDNHMKYRKHDHIIINKDGSKEFSDTNLKNEIWDCFKYITGLNELYWLKDSLKNRNIGRSCIRHLCFFDNEINSAPLLLKLPK